MSCLLIFFLTSVNYNAFALTKTSVTSLKNRPWKVWRTAENIQISTRAASVNNLIEIKAELVISSTADAFIDFIKQPDYLKLWLDNLKSADIKIITPEQSELTIRFNAIWPFTERIMKIKSTVQRQADSSVFIKVIDIGDELSPAQDAITVTIHQAHWLLTPLDNNQLNVHYQFIADANGDIPYWLANKLSLLSIWKSLSKVKQLLNNKNTVAKS